MKLSTKFYTSLLASSILVTQPNALKADWDYWAVKENSNPDLGLDFFTVDNATGNATLRTTKCFKNDDYLESTCMLTSPSTQNYIEPSTGDIYWQDPNSRMQSYNLATDTWTDRGVSWKPNYDSTYARPNVVGTSGGGAKIELDGTKLYELKSDGTVQIGSDSNDIDISTSGLNIGGSSVIKKNSDGSIQIGTDSNDIDISGEGLLVDGVSLITKKDSGEIHIGKNSLITKEEDGVQKLYAKDENGEAININVTNGSKLLINGVEVQTGNSNQVTTNKNNISTNKANINNLGEGVAGSTALTAALSALPQTSKESKLSCGIGTGAYSSRYAVGFGCASKVNQRFDINAGGSYVFGGSKSYGAGTLDSGVVKAGFVFKLGELSKPTQISMKDNKNMETKIANLSGDNEKLQNKVSILMARLERLEKIASRDIKSKDLAYIEK